MYLEDHHCFEEAFRVYERGVSLFHFPHSRGIWREYLSRFISRYGGNKLERARELFERVRFPREFVFNKWTPATRGSFICYMRGWRRNLAGCVIAWTC